MHASKKKRKKERIEFKNWIFLGTALKKIQFRDCSINNS
jgi:hypothetical protein